MKTPWLDFTEHHTQSGTEVHLGAEHRENKFWTRKGPHQTATYVYLAFGQLLRLMQLLINSVLAHFLWQCSAVLRGNKK